MHFLLPRLEPVLAVLNQCHGANQAVELKTIVRAIKEAGAVDQIIRLPSDTLNTGKLWANYAAAVDDVSKTRTAVVTHLSFDGDAPIDDPKNLEIRFAIAKELIHAFDNPEEKTQSHEAVIDLMEQIVQREVFNGTKDFMADKNAIWGAIELLVRWEVRELLEIGSFEVDSARETGNWEHIAKSFLVPSWAARIAFNKVYNDYIKQVRLVTGMKKHVWDLGNGC